MLCPHCTRMNLWMKPLRLSRTELLESFQFHGTLYGQINGVARVPLKPSLASVFMSSIKEKLDIQGKLPPCYRRYVHDTLYMVPDLSTARDFLNTLNHTHPAMKFTMEVKNNGMSPSSVFNS